MFEQLSQMLGSSNTTVVDKGDISELTKDEIDS